MDILKEHVLVTGPKVVSAGHSAAAAAGAAAFGRGGNAFDAALSACFMEHIVLPMKCGLAGDLVALFRTNGGPFRALVSIGAGARALADGAVMQRTGPTSVGVPGAPQGYSLLHGFARLDMGALVAPAVTAATAGVPWSRVAHSYVVEGAALLAQYSPDNPYTKGGRIPDIGEVRKLPGLGLLLGIFAEKREALFESDLGKRIVATVRERGGFLSMEDFAQRPGHILETVRGEVSAGRTLEVTPPPTHGSQLIDIVRRVLAQEVDILAAVRAERERAKARGREAADAGTSVVTAADDGGNAVVIVHSNSFPQMASGIVLDEGLILNNRPGRGFDLGAPENARNAPKAGRTPLTTLHAWALAQENSLVIGATPGGVNQLPWNCQTVTELSLGQDIAEVMTNPRWSLDAENVMAGEAGVDPSLPAAKHIEAFSLRSVQQVIELSTTGLHRAAADPRSGGTAIAVY